MLRWYDHVMISMFAWVISQGLIYNLFWAVLGYAVFVNYMGQRRDGNV
jgi:hypothetical protein